MSNNLIQCGHCNGNAFIDADFGPGWVEYWAECGQCGVRTQEYTTEEQAASVWNTRAAQITPQTGEAEDGRYSLGLCADGCAILYDGVPVTVDDVIRRLNRTAPACADPECWQRPSAVAPVWQPKCDLYRVGPYDTKRGGYPVLRGTDGASWGLFITRDDATDWARYRNCLIDIHGTDALPSPPDVEEDDPTPWCHICGARTKDQCHCGPIARND